MGSEKPDLRAGDAGFKGRMWVKGDTGVRGEWEAVVAEGGESANSISVFRVREIFDLERWANREREDVIREVNVPAFDFTEGGGIAWADVKN
jgi:hypothetical protein